jgi:hypothetical protein
VEGGTQEGSDCNASVRGENESDGTYSADERDDDGGIAMIGDHLCDKKRKSMRLGKARHNQRST